jgi:hypothetical protein
LRLSGRRIFAAVFVYVGWSQAHAQNPPSELGLKTCKPQIELYCPAKSEAREIMICLHDHDTELSIECKQEIQRFFQASRQAASRGGGALTSMGGLTALTPQVPILSYEGRSSPKHPSLDDNKLSFSSPVFKTETDTLAMSANGSRIHLGEALLLDSGATLPADLYRAEIGTQYSHRLGLGKNWGLRGSFGTAGDKVGESPSFSLMGTYAFPGNGGLWVLSIYIANNSPLGNYIPIPGVMYFFKTANVTTVVGFPVTSVQWTPVNPWSFSFSVYGPILTTEAAYGSAEDAQFFTDFAWGQQNFILSNRVQEKDRLTIEEKKIVFGFRTPIWENARGEVQFGTAFDRSAYIGQGFFSKAGGQTPLQSDTYASWSVKKAF